MKMSPISRNALIFLACILFAQIIVRGVFFQEHLFFHDEQARDSFVILRAWQQKEFITLGPIQAETGGVKLGPLYYYLLAPFALLFQFHPAAGTVLISLLWLLTLRLVFVYAYKRGSPLLATFFLLFLVIQENFFVYTSIALNTGILFFFEAAFLISVLEWIRTRKRMYWISTFIALAFLLHAHLTSFMVLPFLLIVHWVYRKRISWRMLAAYTILPLSYLPMLLYDVTHHFTQSKRFFHFAFFKHAVQQADEIFTVFSGLKAWLISSLVSHNALQFYNWWWFDLFVYVLFLYILLRIARFLFQLHDYSFTAVRTVIRAHHVTVILTLFTFFILLGNVLIHTSKPRHYILIFFIPFLVLAERFSHAWSKSVIHKISIVFFMIAFVLLNAWNVKQEFAVQDVFPLNQPYEGFSSIYHEQSELAKTIAAFLRASPHQYKIRTTKPHEIIGRVMKYLILYHNDFYPLFAAQDDRSYRVLFFSSRALSDATPLFSSRHLFVYELTRKEWKQLEH